MIDEKMAIKLYPINTTCSTPPVIWYDLTKLVFDYENNIVKVSFFVSTNILKMITETLLDKNLIPSLWFSHIHWDDTIDDMHQTKYIPIAKINKIRFLNYSWGWNKQFVTECSIEFKFKEVEFLEDEIYNNQIYYDNRDFFIKGGLCDFSLISNDKIANFSDFDINISFDNSLFPIEFMCSKNFSDKNTRDNLYSYFLENKKDLQLIFNVHIDKEFYSIKIDGCNIDFLFIDKDIGHYQEVQHNLVIYGGASKTANLLFNNSDANQVFYTSLIEHIKDEPASRIFMKDRYGNIIIEL